MVLFGNLALNKTSCAAHRAILSNFLDVDRLGVFLWRPAANK
jgi:hypothetical protein